MAQKKLEVVITGDAKGVKQAFNEVDRASSGFDSKLKGIGTGIAGTFGKVAVGIGAAAGALGVGLGAAAGGMLGYGVKIAADMEQARIGFTTMLGSAEKADAFIKQMQDFAARTPFEFAGLQESASKLLAVGVEAERVIPIMTVLGDATSAVGTGEEGIQRAVMALGQMQQKGKVTGEEMLQLVEAGVPAWDALASKLGVDVATAQDMVSKNQVKVNDLFSAIETSAGPALTKVKGMMDAQSASLSGMVSSLKDTIAMGLGSAAAPLAESLKGQLPVIQQAMTGLMAPLSDVGSSVVTALGPLLSAITPLVGTFATVFSSLGPIIGSLAPVFAALAPVVAQVATTLAGILMTALDALGPVIIALAPHFSKLVETLGMALMPVLAKLIPPLGEILIAIAPLLPMIAELAGTVLLSLAEAIAPVISAVAPMITQLVEGLKPVLVEIQPMIKELAGKIGKDLLDATLQILPPLLELTLALLPIIPPIVRILVEVLKLTALLPILTTVLGAVAAAASWAWREVIWPAIEFVVTWFQTTAWPIIQTVAGFIGQVFSTIGTVAVTIWNGVIMPAINAVVTWFMGTAWPIIQSVASFIGNAFSVLSTVVSTVWNAISTAIGVVVGFIQGTVWPGIQSAAGLIGGAFDTLKSTVTTVWDGIRNTISGVVDFVTGIPGKIRGIWDGIWDGLSSGLSGVINRVKDLWNGFARSFSIDLPLGGGTIGLPTFHTGGTFHAPTPGGTGIAVLRDGEHISTPGREPSGGHSDAKIDELIAAVLALASSPTVVAIDSKPIAMAVRSHERSIR